MLSKDTLPTDVPQLHALCIKLQSALLEKEKALSEQALIIQDKETHIEHLQEQLNLLRSQRYQSRSEQLNTLQGQLFDEAELEQAIRETREALEQAQVPQNQADTSEQGLSKPKDRPKRKPLPDHLRRVDVIIDVSEEDKQMMGDKWVAVGHEISEQVAVKQREYYIKRYMRVKYVLKDTPANEAGQLEAGIKVAPRPDVMLPKSLADASLLADVIASKFVDALSFYRKEKILAREGIDIGYSTLCDWPIQLTRQLAPLEALLYEHLQQCDLWYLDETVLQVLQEPNRKNTHNSYLWAIRAGPPQAPVVLFHYDARRSFDALEAWLSPYIEDFSGVIMSDEHKPYNTLARQYTNIQAHGGCWAHLRRKFSDAAKGRKNTSEAHKMLTKIAALYKQDNALQHLSGEAKLAARRDKVQPHIIRIKQYLDQLSGEFVAQGLMNTAVHYALNNWHKFTAFIDHPSLPLDNNPVEQAIRPFTLGRKNWLFAGSPRGAHASAFMYSLIETAKANGWEPKAYLQALFERYPHARNDDQRRALLPMFLKTSS